MFVSPSCPNEMVTEPVRVGPGMYMERQREVASDERCRQEDTELSVMIEQGMADGTDVKFPRMASQTPKQVPGDVIITLRTRPHSVFTREGNDLRASIEISLKEALLGFHHTLEHLDGHSVDIERDAGRVTQVGDVLTVQGEGMPHLNFPSERGDLHVVLKIKMPRTLTKAQQVAIEGAF